MYNVHLNYWLSFYSPKELLSFWRSKRNKNSCQNDVYALFRFLSFVFERELKLFRTQLKKSKFTATRRRVLTGCLLSPQIFFIQLYLALENKTSCLILWHFKIWRKNQLASNALSCVEIVWAVREALQTIGLMPCRF